MRMMIALLVFAGIASADLIIDVTDLGGGQSRWQFSGSATVDAANIGYNGFYGRDWDNGDPFTNDVNQAYPFVSGGVTVSSTTAANLTAVEILRTLGAPGAAQSAAPRYNVPGGIPWIANDLLSWSGGVTVDLPYSELNPGVYQTNTLIGGYTLDGNGVVLTINASPIPEPGTSALFGLALAGYAIYRRRRAA